MALAIIAGLCALCGALSDEASSHSVLSDPLSSPVRQADRRPLAPFYKWGYGRGHQAGERPTWEWHLGLFCPPRCLPSGFLGRLSWSPQLCWLSLACSCPEQKPGPEDSGHTAK